MSSKHTLIPDHNKQAFFNFILERQRIYHKKEVLKEQYPWTEDEVLRKFKFCNVFRELDKGTKIIQEQYDLLDRIDFLFNVFIYRIFNRKDLFVNNVLPLKVADFDRIDFVRKMEEFRSKTGTIFSDAYLTCSKSFYRGVAAEIGVKYIQFSYVIEDIHRVIHDLHDSLYGCNIPERALSLISQFNMIGGFLSYQIFLDLCEPGYLGLTENDYFMIGPGAETGLTFVMNREDKDNYPRYKELEEALIELYDSQEKYLDSDEWRSITFSGSVCHPYLSLSAIEFCLCEFRKYNNLKTGKGKRRLYRAPN